MSDPPKVAPSKEVCRLYDCSLQALIKLLESRTKLPYPQEPLPLPVTMLEMMEAKLTPRILCDLLLKINGSHSTLLWKELLPRTRILLPALSVTSRSTEMHKVVQDAAFYLRQSNFVNTMTKSVDDKLKRSDVAEARLIRPQVVFLASILLDLVWPSFAEVVLCGLLNRDVATDEADSSDLKVVEAKVLLLSALTMQLKLAEAGILVEELSGINILSNDGIGGITATQLRATFNLECCRFYLATSAFELAFSKAMEAVDYLREEHPVRLAIDVYRVASQAGVMRRKFDIAKVLIREAVLLARGKFGRKHVVYIEAIIDLGFFWQHFDSDFRAEEICEFLSRNTYYITVAKRFLEVRFRELKAELDLDHWRNDRTDSIYEIIRHYKDEDAHTSETVPIVQTMNNFGGDAGDMVEDEDEKDLEVEEEEDLESDDFDMEFDEEDKSMYFWDKLWYVRQDYLVEDDHPLAANAQRLDAMLNLTSYYKKTLRLIWKRAGGLDAKKLQDLDKDVKAKLLSSLETAEKTFGQKSLQTARHLDSLGVFYWKTWQVSLSESMLTRAVVMKEAVLGPEDFEVALTLRHLARVHLMRKEYGVAAPLFVRCINILRKMEPPHRLLESDYDFLIMCYSRTGNFRAALKWDGRRREFLAAATRGPHGRPYPDNIEKAALEVDADEPQSLGQVVEELSRLGAFA